MSADATTATSAARLASWRDAATAGALPLPNRGDRWQPLRAGLVNLWEYDIAEVWYGDGRLQLQGANESGKSTLMTLTTLLLLTGDISGHNIDTLGDSGKRFWYYVEPTDHPLDRRDPSAAKHRGWAWAEYGRQSENGPEFFTTLLFAEARRSDGGKKLQWCTLDGRSRTGPARVRSGITLANAGLIAEPGQFHAVPGFVAHKTGAQYRDEIARTLFTTDASWLDQLIRILRVVRTPKIGDRLDLRFLTQAFRTALPPLADDEVNQLADGWEQLERMRDERDTTEQALAAITEFTRTRWRPWADAVIRSAADPVIAATSALTQVTRDERTAKEALDRLSDEERTLNGQMTTLREERGRAVAEREELQQQQAYRDAVAVAASAQQLAEAAHRAEALAARSTERARTAKAQIPNAERRLEIARDRAATAGQEIERAAGHIASHAEPAGLAEITARFLPERDTARLRQANEQRTRAAEHALRLLATHREAVLQADAAVQKSQEAAQAAATARQEVQDAVQKAEAAITTVATLLAAWAARLPPRLRPTPRLLEGWVRRVSAIADADPPTPVLAGMVGREHLSPTRRPLENRAAQLTRDRAATEQALAAASEDIAAVQAETDPRPDPPVLWRRRERPDGVGEAGAPLWRLVEAVPGLPDAAIAVLEATLEATGLLQAWVTPDGAYLRDRDGADSVWVSTAAGAGSPPAHPGRTLRDVLTPADDAGPELRSVVDSLLHTLAYPPTLPDAGSDGGAAITIAADGRWRHGGLTGTAMPAEDGPQLLGAAARATSRARRIRALQDRIAELEARAEHLATQSGDVAADLATLDQAADQLQTADGPVVAAVVELRHARRAEETAARTAQHAEKQASAARGKADEAAAAVAAHADEHGLPRDHPQVQDVLHALGNHLAAVRELATALKQLPPLQEAVDEADADLQAQWDTYTQAEKDAAHDGEEARTLRARADAAARSLTQEAQEIIGRVDTLGRQIAEHDRLLEQLSGDLQGLVGRKSRAEVVLEQVSERRQAAEDRRSVAVAGWFACVDAGLPRMRELPDSRDRHLTAALESARVARTRITPRDWPDDPTAAMQRVQALWARLVDQVAVLRSRLEQLGGRSVRTTPPGESGMRFGAVQVVVDGTGAALPPPTAQARLTEQLARLQASYDEELERTINQLLGSTFIEHLRERLIDAERLRVDINAKLAENPTTTSGLTLRLVRVPVAEEQAANDVLTALERSFALLPDSTQDQVRQFLARRIADAQEAARAAGDADWRGRLAEILDYRRWFELRLEYRSAQAASGNGKGPSRWHRLDRDNHSLLSGGAKVVTLLQPFVAALHAMYDQSGVGPRMLWLDEAFDGVDPDNRATMLRLLTACDLDWMIAGPGPIANSPTVPMASIYEVRRGPRPYPGVSLELAVWAGGQLTHVMTPDPADLIDLAAVHDAEEPGHLFSVAEG